MTKQTKQSKRKEIAEAREKSLSTHSIEDIHYGETFFFDDVALWGIRPIRLLVDAVDNLQCDNDYEALPLLLNEVQRHLDELMEACERWDTEERKAKDNVVPRPIRQELLRLEAYLEGVPGDPQDARDSFERLKPLLAGLEKEHIKADKETSKEKTMKELELDVGTVATSLKICLKSFEAMEPRLAILEKGKPELKEVA